MCYKNQDELDQIAMDAWMDELDAEYLELVFLEEVFLEEAAARDAESKFDYFQEF